MALRALWVPSTFRALTSLGTQGLQSHPPSQCQAVIPDDSPFLCPQVEGLREGWERAEALPAPSLAVSHLPISVLGEPWAGAARAVPSLAPGLSALPRHSQICCGSEFLPRSTCVNIPSLLRLPGPAHGKSLWFWRGAAEPSLLGTHPAAAGPGLLHLWARRRWHAAFGCLALVLPRAPSAHIPYLGALPPSPA